MATIERKVIEWTPGKWWIVDHDPRPFHGYTPIAGPFPSQHKAEEALAQAAAR